MPDDGWPWLEVATEVAARRLLGCELERELEGETLRDVLRREGPLPPERAMSLAADICGALDFSHRNGIVHRDVKPGNVMITPQGSVKVMDFGIARAMADAQATMTQTSSVIGTAQYISPEQAEGQTVDHRSDVYSTGCLLFELLTGRTPFTGDPIALASALRKLQYGTARAPLPPSPELVNTSHMMIANPFRAADVSRFFATHPPMPERIARLEEMAGQRLP